MPIFDPEHAAGGEPHGPPLADSTAWFDAPASQRGGDELEGLLAQLREQENSDTPPAARIPLLNTLYTKCMYSVETRLPALTKTPVPVPGKARSLIRAMQEILGVLAEHLLVLDEELEKGSPESGRGTSALMLWRALHALSRHLLISSLTASPPGPDIWRQLHRVYNRARLAGVTRDVPAGAPRSLQDEYYATVLLGCAQPTSFAGAEIAFLDDYLERFSGQIDSNRDKPTESAVMFWIDPTRDVPATPYNRKPPPPETPVRYFSCSRLAALLKQQVAALEAGTPPAQIDLPPFAATPGGRGVLGRLIGLWGTPGKRRFPRRRQNYRGELCFGFDNLCRLYRRNPQPVETSVWMITNESPDGYSAMHVSGKTGTIAVGDVAALRTETGNNRQLCIIRWVLSENQEHVELGLQILSARAYTADLALPAEAGTNTCQPALVLPATPTLRPEEALVVPTGALGGYSRNLVLVIERDNIEVREINTAQRDELNSLIELYEIEARPPQD